MDKLQAMAEALAASVPEYLGKPTIPPNSWAQNGDVVTVILADGRKVEGRIQYINDLMFRKSVVDKLKPGLKPELKPDFDNVKVDLKSAAPVRKPRARK